MSNTQLQREIVENEGLTLSKGTNDISDVLSSVHHFIRVKAVELKDVHTEEVLETIEKFFYFEENSDWQEVTGYPANITPDPFIEDVYYGLAYVQDEHSHKAMEYFQETLAPLLNELAPEGYSFMSHEGSTSDFGFYQSVED